MNLKELVEKYQDQFKDTTFFGVPLTSLSKDELMAAIIMVNKEGLNYIKESHRRMGIITLSDLEVDALDRLCAEFRRSVFTKAGKVDPKISQQTAAGPA